MKAQLINLGNGKVVVVNDEDLLEQNYVCDEDGNIGIVISALDKHNVEVDYPDAGGKSITCIVKDCNEIGKSANEKLNKIIAGHDSLPAISNIDNVFELWKEAIDQNTDDRLSKKELFHLFQLSLIPEVLNIEWDEINNKILKVII